MTVEQAVRESTMSVTEAVKLSTLLCPEKSLAMVTLSGENSSEYAALETVASLRTRLSEVLYNRVVGNNQLLSSSLLCDDIKSNSSTFAFDHIDYDVMAVFTEYFWSHCSGDGFGPDIADFLGSDDAVLFFIALAITQYGVVTPVGEIDEIDIYDLIDAYADWLEETYSEEELNELKDNCRATCEAISNAQKYLRKEVKTVSKSDWDLAVSIAIDVKHMIMNTRIFGNVGLDSLTTEDVILHFEVLCANFCNTDFDGDRYLYVSKPVASYINNRKSFPNNDITMALDRAIEYIKTPKWCDAPGTGDIWFCTDKVFAVTMCLGGYAGESWSVDTIHLNTWWHLAFQVIETLLPEVLKTYSKAS